MCDGHSPWAAERPCSQPYAQSLGPAAWADPLFLNEHPRSLHLPCPLTRGMCGFQSDHKAA